MGSWDEGIMGGDTPLDYQADWEDRFGGGWDYDSEPEVKIPLREGITADDVYEFGKELSAMPHCDQYVMGQVLGYKTMECGIPMNQRLRDSIVASIDNEIADGCQEWCSPETRIARLQEFRACVLKYPERGLSPLENNPWLEENLVRTPGLFEKIAETFG